MDSNRCAACKVLKGTCGPECIFAPHFPSSKPMRFENIHKIFGADSLYKILNNLEPTKHADAVNSLCYEAEARKRDPIHGFYGIYLHHQTELNNLQHQINSAVNELGTILTPDKIPPFSHLPMPDNFLDTQSPNFFETGSDSQNVQLPAAEAQKIVDEMFLNIENQEMGDIHGVVGASTSAGPSMT